MIHQLKIDLDASLYARITEALGYSLAVGFISDFLADLRGDCTGCWCSAHGPTAPSVCASGACGGAASHGWISSERDRHRPSAACRAQQDRNFVSVDFVVLRFAAVDGFYVMVMMQ